MRLAHTILFIHSNPCNHHREVKQICYCKVVCCDGRKTDLQCVVILLLPNVRNAKEIELCFLVNDGHLNKNVAVCLY